MSRGHAIIDEFSDLPISRQRKLQLRRTRDGICQKCNEPRISATLCLKHAVARREEVRARTGAKAELNSLTRRLERLAAYIENYMPEKTPEQRQKELRQILLNPKTKMTPAEADAKVKDFLKLWKIKTS